MAFDFFFSIVCGEVAYVFTPKDSLPSVHREVFFQQRY
jgi:hypothetical protein